MSQKKMAGGCNLINMNDRKCVFGANFGAFQIA